MTVPTPFTNTDPQFSLPLDGQTDAARAEARKRLVARRKMASDVVSYVVINAFLVVVWLMTGAGYFWPGWVMAGWGIFLLLHVYDVLWRRPITEADVAEEIRRHG